MNSLAENKQESEPGLEAGWWAPASESANTQRRAWMGSGHCPLQSSPSSGFPRCSKSQGQQSPVPGRGWTGQGKTLQGLFISERGCVSKVGTAFDPDLGDWETPGGSEGPRVRGGQFPIGALSPGLPPSPCREPAPSPPHAHCRDPRGGGLGWGWVCSG